MSAVVFGRKKARVQTAPETGQQSDAARLASKTSMKFIQELAKDTAFTKRAMDDDLDSLDGDSPTTLKEKRNVRKSLKVRSSVTDVMMQAASVSFLGRTNSAAVAMRLFNDALLQRDASMIPKHQPRFGAQLTRDLSHITEVVQNTDLREVLRKAVIAAWMCGSFVTYTFMCKVVFGAPGRTVVPDTYSAIALAQVLCSVIYALCILFVHKGELMWVLRALLSPKYLLVCLPYSIGYALNYWLWCEGIKYLSTATGTAIMQARLFLDMFIAYVLMSTSVPVPKFMLVVACFVAVAAHTMTVPQGPMSTNPALGRLLFMLFVAESALQYAWLPWAIPKYDLLPGLLSYLSAVMTAGVSVFLYWLGSEKGISGIADGYIVSDMAVFIAWLSIDAAAFFCPIWVSPLFLTLCCCAGMPILYLLEMLVFGEPFRLAQFTSVVAVTFSVVAVGLYSVERGGRVGRFDDKK